MKDTFKTQFNGFISLHEFDILLEQEERFCKQMDIKFTDESFERKTIIAMIKKQAQTAIFCFGTVVSNVLIEAYEFSYNSRDRGYHVLVNVQMETERHGNGDVVDMTATEYKFANKKYVF